MITGELKSKVDRIWDTMWSGGISNPLSVIEQLTYLLFIKTNSGGTDHVWYYDMQRDGFSLDDKRTPLVNAELETRIAECLKKGKAIPEEIHKATNIPDILAKWRGWRSGSLPSSEFRARTSQSFCVPSSEIRANDYDLSINRYKEVEYEAVQHDSPQEILQRLAKLEEEIAAGQKELEGMVGSGK